MAVIVKQFQNLKKELKSATGCTVTYSKITGRKQANLYIKHSDEKGKIKDSNFELIEDLFREFIHDWDGFLMEDENGATTELECTFDNFLLIEDQGIKDEILSLLTPSTMSANGKAISPVKNLKAGRRS
ncbi:MAG: hypothetical protein ACYS3N_23865 [Planctomycetota bacterium]|jgi:hypothetical protein